MSIHNKFIISCLVLMCSGCSSVGNVQSIHEVLDRPDEFFAQGVVSKESTYGECPTIASSSFVDDRKSFWGDGEKITFQLRTNGCGEDAKYQLLLLLTYAKSWRLYDRVVDQEKRTLPMETLWKDMLGCTGMISAGSGQFSEDLAIILDDNDLDRGAKSGMTLTLFGKEGLRTKVNIPSNFIKGFKMGYERSLKE